MKRKLTIMAIVVLFASLVCLTALPTTADATTNKAIAVSGYADAATPDRWGAARNFVAARYTSWGYDTWNVFAPSKTELGAHIGDNKCKITYIVAHGGSTSFNLQDGIPVRASDIETWFQNRDKISFALIHHCGGMCSSGPGTFSHAYRKGSYSNTVTVGFCNLFGENACGNAVYGWTHTMFDHVETGATWKEAFDHANACYPQCIQNTKFVGDESMTLADCLEGPPICGDVNGDGYVRLSDGRAIFRYLTFGDPIENLWGADVTGDGKITTADGRRIFRHLTFGDPLTCRCC